MASKAEYGAWRSPISPATLTKAQIGLSAPSLMGDSLFYLASLPQEQGRTTLYERLPDGYVIERTPAPFYVRSRVHEYGGGAYAVGRRHVLAVNSADQRLYRLAEGEQQQALPITPASEGALRYADLTLSADETRVFAVREDHRVAGEPQTTLVAIPLDGGEHEGRVLAQGHDFYLSPRPSPDGRCLAFVAWDHPNMPWDTTTLYLAALDEDGGLSEVRRIAGGDKQSVVEPTWSPDNSLYFIADARGWWNLHRHNTDGNVNILPLDAEFAPPAWQFGNASFGITPKGAIVGCVTIGGTWQLYRLDQGTAEPVFFDLPYTSLSHIQVVGERAVLRAGAPDRPHAIIALDLTAGGAVEAARAGEQPVSSAYLARPESVIFPTADGKEAHSFLYLPTNPDYKAPEGTSPPLIVKSHGGPTSAARPELNLMIQFWTSRGFAFADVNYGGSTGFGRAYRQRLYGQWGVVDVRDCAALAEHLTENEVVDGDRLAVTGGSAGGYTTLACLAFTDTFKVGASHYGVSDLELLAAETHKFEARYLDRLVGPYPEAKGIYRARSPLHHVERITCPVLFFQGLEDKVVPPNQARLMVQALRGRGLRAELHEFPGEGHGFRTAATIETVAREELAFFADVFGIGLPDD